MTRKSLTERRRTEALADELHGLFRALEQRPVPQSIASVVDQLDQGEPQPGRKIRRG